MCALMVQDSSAFFHWPFFSRSHERVSEKKSTITIFIDYETERGRAVGNDFESALMSSCAREIQRIGEASSSIIKIITAQDIPEMITLLERTSVINIKKPSLYLRIGAFHCSDGHQSLALYHFLQNQVTDWWYQKKLNTFFIPCDGVYLEHLSQSRLIGKRMGEVLKKEVKDYQLNYQGMVGLPLTYLEGINAPAMYSEMGIVGSDDSILCAQLISGALLDILPLLSQEE